MTDLIERLQKATGPDRELDYEIAVLVRGQRFPINDNIPAYTGNIDEARQLLVGLPMPGFTVQWVYMGMGNWTGRAAVGIHGNEHWSEAENPAIALSIAALRAREEHDRATIPVVE